MTVLPTLLAAQEPAPRPSTPAGAPAMLLPPQGADAGFSAWATDRASEPEAFRPQRIQTGRFDVLLLPSRARTATATDSLFAAFSRTCRAELEDDVPADSSALAALDAWREFDEATAARALIAIQVTPTRTGASDCGARAQEHVASVVRGVRFGSDSRYAPASDARSAELWADGARVEPAMSGSRPVLHVSGDSIWSDSTRQVRLYVPIDAFAATTTRGIPRMELRIWNASSDTPIIIPIPRVMVDELWSLELPWRAARLAAAGPGATWRPRFPVPRDRALRDAHARFASGDVASAASHGVARLVARRELSRSDRRVGRLVTAFALSEGGDSAASATLLASAVEADPCLTLAEAADDRHARVLDASRRPARCTVDPKGQVARRALVPGLAQLRATRRGTGYVFMTAFAATAGTSIVSEFGARAAYRRYETMTTPNGAEAARLYDDASTKRELGNATRAAALAIWALSGADVLLSEWRHRRGVAAVTRLGDAPAARLSLQPVPGGAGIALSFATFR